MSPTLVKPHIIVLLMGLVCFVSQAMPLILDESAIAQRHEQWMAFHGRTYQTFQEKERRFNTFKQNLEFIENFNNINAANQSYKLGVNAFADLTNQEFMASYTGFKMMSVQTSENKRFRYENVTEIPGSLDWRKKGAVTQIKDQGDCGSCWAFSAVTAIEGAIKIKTGKLISLSEQQLVDCAKFSGTNGCDGGWMDDAFKYVASYGGINGETEYKYKAKERTCKAINKTASSHAAATIAGYEDVPPNDEEALLKAVTMQPVSVCIDCNTFQFYSSGVYAGPCGTEMNHGVTVVGFGTTEDGTKYWLVKNSWGRHWGEYGYMRLKRDIDSPKGLCGIARKPSYPIA